MHTLSIQPTQSVTVKQDFECTYFLDTSDGNIDVNAHRYRVEVTVRRIGDVCNRIMEFYQLQDILKSILPDSKYLYSDNPGTIQYIIGQLLENTGTETSTVKFKFELCAENICNWIANTLQDKLNVDYSSKLEVSDVVLRENSYCFVNWHKHEIANKE